MKKSYLFGLLALVLGFTACDDIADAPGKPQTNPQETIIPATGFDVQTIVLGPATVDLENLLADDEPIAIGEITAVPGELGDNYQLVPRVWVSDDENFANHVIIEGENVDGKLYVTPLQLEDALVNVYGLNPIVRTPYIGIALYAVDGRSQVRVGGTDVFFAKQQPSIEQAVKVWVDTDYYLVFADNAGNPDPSTAVLMNHEGDNQYDFPEFNTLVEVENNDTQWFIAPKSTLDGIVDIWYGVVPVKGDSGMEIKMTGSLDEGQAGLTPGLFKSASAYRVTVNMVEMTYDTKFAYSEIYLAAKWSAWTARGIRSYKLTTDEYYTHYRGFALIKDEYRYMTTPDFGKKGNYQIGAIAGEESAFSGILEMNTTSSAHASGLVWTDVNLVNLTFNTYELTSVGVVGALQGWNAGEPIEMTSTRDMVYTADVTVADDNSLEFKFIFNKAWDIAKDVNVSLGGELDKLIPGSNDNLKFPAAGAYTVTLDLSAYPYTATLTAK